MKKIIITLQQSSFLRHNIVLFAGSVVVGALNYVYYPALGRLLTPTTFGEVQTLVSLFLQLTTFLTVLSLVVINVVASYANITRRNHIILELEKLMVIGAIAMLLLVIVFAEPIRQFLQFQSSWPFVILAAALVVTVPFTSRTAYLRGVRRFMASSVANVVGAGSKILFSVALVLIGLGTSGAIAGLTLAQICALGYASWRSKLVGFARPADFKHLALPQLRVVVPELRYAFFVLTGSLGVMVLFSADVVIVKRFFDAHTAGLYAGVAAVARIIFFLTASVSQVLMPSVKVGKIAANRQLFKKSALLLVVVSAPVLAVCMLTPQFAVSVLMGHTYLAYASLLPVLALATFVVSVLNLVVLYFLALRQYAPALLAMAGAVATCSALMVFHATLAGVVALLLAGGLATIAAIAVWAALASVRTRMV